MREEFLVKDLAAMESLIRACYPEPILMSSGDFIEMMLLNACFVVELLLHIYRSEYEEDDPIFSRPWIIPTLIMDLLKLENQLPFSPLETFFYYSSSTGELVKTGNLSILALRVFDLAFPRPLTLIKDYGSLSCQHLLHLFYLTLTPFQTDHDLSKNCRPWDQSIPRVKHLKPSGIKFKPAKAESFLDISFCNQVLEIPSITMNDFMTTVFINCVALEQCQEDGPKYLTDYISFMHCLINQPQDAASLCSDGIITRFSHDNQYVANLFSKLGKSVVFNVHDCYLSKQFEDIESYFSSNWATWRRTYFSSPWSFISVYSAFLIIILSMTQTVFTVLSYHFH